jgi:hypothetical protein
MAFLKRLGGMLVASIHRLHPAIQVSLKLGIIRAIKVGYQSRNFQPLFHGQFCDALFDFRKTHTAKIA